MGVDRDDRLKNLDFGPRIHVIIGDTNRKSILDRAYSLLPSVVVVST